LVFGAGPLPAMGGPGAGLALTVAGAIGGVLQLALALRRGALPGFLQSRPAAGGAGAVGALAWPISLQQALLQVGFVVAYLIVARLGVATVAATNVLITLASVPAQLAVGLGVAAATLVGQTLGRGDAAEARRWGWRVAAIGLLASAPFALAALFATRPLVGVFLHDPVAQGIALWPVRIVGFSVVAQTSVQVISFALRGAGATRISAGIAFAAQWAIELPLAWLLALPLGFGLVGLASIQAAVVIAHAGVIALVWAGGSWTAHRMFSKTS
jgi:Na+-driven multidrug efflux pump